MKINEKEYTEFYSMNFTWVFRFIRSKIPIIEDAEDIAFETFNAIWLNWDSIDKTKNLNPFLFRICRNKVNDFLRKKYSINIKDVEFKDEFIEEVIKNEKPVIENPILIKLKEILQKNLNEKERKIINLKYFNNMTFKDIGDELGLTENNVKVINFRTLKKIKKIWETKM